VTFAQARVEATRDLREVRRVYRKADTQGEVVERALDRLIGERKRIVTSSQLLPLIEKWREYKAMVDDMERALFIATKLLATYEL
jgi:hypothetical protein